MRFLKLAVIFGELLYAASVATSSQAGHRVAFVQPQCHRAAFVQTFVAQPVVEYRAAVVAQPVYVAPQAFVAAPVAAYSAPVAAPVAAYSLPVAAQQLNAVAPARKFKQKIKGAGVSALVAPQAFVAPVQTVPLRPVQRQKIKIKTR